MKLRGSLGLLIVVAVLSGGSFTLLRGSAALDAGKTLSNDAGIAENAVMALRNSGPDGLATVLADYDRSHDERLIPAIEAVAAQRDAVWSRLYWYTDLERAKTAAKAQNKPILYLRLMGKLTDEYSCANSRFFRTVLYANHDVSKLMREEFILVWGSERPVPVVTIDYGDGRKLKRTLTGNSIHYVLTPEGKVVDALPGLYAPQTFKAILGAARVAAFPRNTCRFIVQSDYQSATIKSLEQNWINDQARVGPANVTATAKADGPVVQNANALGAMRRAVSKTAVEMPLLARMMPKAPLTPDQLIGATDAAMWRKIADLHIADAKLDSSSVALLKSKNPTAYSREDDLLRTVEQFESTIALDTVHNEYELRRRILRWLRDSKDIGLEDLNRRVYSELFLTPRSDPWLGLVPDATYSALPEDGKEAASRLPTNVLPELELTTIDPSALKCFAPAEPK